MAEIIEWSWDEVDEMEAKNYFKAAIFHMREVWLNEPGNLKVFLRLSFLSWHVVVEWPTFDESDLEEEDHTECVMLLRSLLNYGQNHFQESADFQWLFGYMMYLFPFYFGSDFDQMEGTAKEMLKKAYILRPEDAILKMTYFENRDNYKKNHEYHYLCNEVTSTLSERFPGNGVLEKYFREVLTRN